MRRRAPAPSVVRPRSKLLRSTLLLSGARRVVVISVPWYLRSGLEARGQAPLKPRAPSAPH
ncbi:MULTISPECIES: hypothetical protein [unclassified Myxococcus]|uniref:hypothetical protein n=1 Tax=unclassified Myxococcus TaxID=2648731 RepID=UPI001CBE275E|nr:MULTISPECIES: hypothetical protein [unclassified Myxococcus]MBZ4399429.1 hypothetical protein [Myxococcus sp. AS-1-15]MBZ4413516.1 hypothetical protein [Myxococcus sp. XM-1-1-1]